MAKLNIIYYSTTGNTEQIAMYLEKGAKEKGVDVYTISADIAMDEEGIMEADFIALGSSAYGSEEICPEMLEFIDKYKSEFNGKKIGLFGSYDWGSGEFMDYWLEEMKGLGGDIIEPLIINLAPDDNEKIELAKNYGRKIVE